MQPEKPNVIMIICDNTSQWHGKKRPTPEVQSYRYHEYGAGKQGHTWLPFVQSEWLKNARAGESNSQSLIGNEKYDHRNKEHRRAKHRISWELTCLKCGYSVPVVQERLYPALTNMRDLGIPKMRLSHIKAGLENPQCWPDDLTL
ncbi:MAG: hypothetical protein HLX51_06495 [Micrococcaceae bacterium]|nr:hypothetical protein [Micrococcaceae bacterium]